MDEYLLERLNRLREIDERLERVAVELCRLGVANPTLEQMRFDVKLWIEAAEFEYANF